MINSLLFLIFIIVTACGKSPFINQVDKNENNVNFNQSVTSDNKVSFYNNSHFSDISLELSNLGLPGLDLIKHDDSPEYQAVVEWISIPVALEFQSLTIRFINQDNAPVDLDEMESIELIPWMWMDNRVMSHGTVPTKTKKIGLGYYEVSNIFFVMNGVWDLRLFITKNNKRIYLSLWQIQI